MEKSILNKVKSSFIQLFTGETVTFFATFLAGYFYALILGPSDYGVWQTAKVFISYSIVFTFSLPFVMRRDFVMLRAEGKHEEARRIADLVFTYELFVTPILSLGLILYSLFYIEAYLLKISMITVGLIYVSQFIGGYSNILAKGLNNYRLLKEASILNAMLTILSIPLVYFWGIKALLIATVIMAIANSVFHYLKRPFNYRIFWDNKLFKTLLVISFPLYLQDISATIFDSIDRLLIARYLNFAEVGFYSLSGLVIIPLRLFISSFSVVLFTQLNEKYGYSKEDSVIEKHVLVPHSILSYLVPPLLGVAVVVLPYVVSIFLPKYLPGIIPAQIALFATFIYLLNSFSANALFVVNKQKKTAIVYLIVGVLKTGLCFLSLFYGYGIIGVALSTVVVYLILEFMMLRIVFIQLKRSFNELLSHFSKLIFPCLWVAIVCIIYIKYLLPYLDRMLPGYTIVVPIVGVCFVLLTSSPLILIGYRRINSLLSKT
ncbi:lipopolysaccharide biosynthesis protein [Pedobacter gandavensis]|uniref:Oligosaccharide flippase family protein n=1 Tax=Pedobacter gandavensis TaxID=2679963 RepID=A0ABR6EX83_9SPHI|nr:oligosaccharide flippase family protein [Pedobacter gandavensis]MBB2149900.1 oligosaccharide flippase family protein [Pedobacter gandavensis]